MVTSKRTTLAEHLALAARKNYCARDLTSAAQWIKDAGAARAQ